MKVLQVNCVYNSGSTGKIVKDIHSELLNNDIESVVCYGRGNKINENNIYLLSNNIFGKINNAISRFKGVLYGGCHYSTIKLINIIKKEKPDIVHLHCLNGFFVNIYEFLKWLGKNNIKVVLTLHAEFMYTGSCGYSYECEKWKQSNGCSDCKIWKTETNSVVGDKTYKSFNFMNKAFNYIKPENITIVSVSPWLMNRAQNSYILKNFEHQCVFNGVDTNIFYNKNIQKDSMFENNADKKIVFHPTSYFSCNQDDDKGGRYIISLADKMVAEKYHFYVAGDYDRNINVTENVTLLGKITDQSILADYYSAADLTLIASKQETFSMVCAESLCCGTPVVGFKAGGPESISLNEYSKFVEYANIDTLDKTIKEFCFNKCKNYDISNNAKDVYSKEIMTKNYIKIYKDLLKI